MSNVAKLMMIEQSDGNESETVYINAWPEAVFEIVRSKLDEEITYWLNLLVNRRVLPFAAQIPLTKSLLNQLADCLAEALSDGHDGFIKDVMLPKGKAANIFLDIHLMQENYVMVLRLQAGQNILQLDMVFYPDNLVKLQAAILEAVRVVNG